MMDGMVFSGVEADRLLWAAVVRRAIHDFVLYKGVRRKALDWKRAYQYLFGKGVRHEEGLSFEDVCALLEWDPDYIRKLTTQLRRSDIMKSTPKKKEPEEIAPPKKVQTPHLPFWMPEVRIHYLSHPSITPFVQWV